jgi:hypothetical protein
MNTMERVDMHEEEEGLMVTHGSLFDLIHDTVKETNIENFMRKYEERTMDRTKSQRFDIQEEAYQKKLHPIKRSRRVPESVWLTNSDYAEALQAQYDHEDAEKERVRVSRIKSRRTKPKTTSKMRTRKSR